MLSFSPIIADLILQDLETEVLDILRIILSFYIRYVDDIMTAPIELIEHILIVFNSFHTRFQFILENERGGGA